MTDLADRHPPRFVDTTQQVVYALSHDFQGPTRHIVAFLQLLEDHLGEGLDDQAQGYIDRVTDAAGALQLKLEAIMRLSRVISRSVEPAPCDAMEVVEEALALFESTIEKLGAIVEVDVSATVVADRSQIVAVLVELIDNSLKFCTFPPRIRIESETSGATCVFRVIDGGPGFEARNPDAAFDLFRRFHTSSVPGTGTGLTIVRRILDRHHSPVTIESTREIGTTVQFALPTDQTMVGGRS